MLRWVCVVLFVSCVVAKDLDLDTHWVKFKSAFKKKFESKHEEQRKQSEWENKVSSILKHNLEADMGIHKYTKGINAFADLTREEFVKKALGLKIPKNITYNYLPPNKMKSERALPTNFDWRDQGAVTSVKDQDTCGSCWSFSVAGTMEGAWFIKTGNLIDFSEQELIDCSTDYDTDGCDGAWPNDAFNYVQAKGLGKYSCYPYENAQSQCRVKKSCKITKISTHYDVPKTEEDLKEYLYNYGPVSVTINANDNFSDYKSGIFDDDTCDDAVNHAVLLVGYGVDKGTPYWTIKNSWGNWGEKGYIRIARGKGMCGIEKYASIPWID